MITSARRDNQQRDENRVAFHCISMAAHPNTGDGEMVGCVHGFRRLARGRTLQEFCIEYFVPANMKALVKEKSDQHIEILQLQESLQEATERAREACERADRAEEKLRVIELGPAREPLCELEPRLKVRWLPAEFEYLACEYEADTTIQNKVLATRCSQHFGREITKDAIGGQIDRLRKSGRLPKYRPGYEKANGSAPAC